MIPYSEFFYFYIMLIALIPAIVLGLMGKQIKYYGIVCSVFMVAVTFGNTLQQMLYLVLFFVFELMLVMGYSYLVKKFPGKCMFWIVILLSIVPIFYTKYGSTILFKQEIGFLGISYMTFRTAQMIIETKNGLIKKINFLDFVYFLLFFPTLSSGPVDRSRRFINDANTKHTTKEYIDILGKGLWKIFQGLAYKFVIAFLLNHFWLSTITHRQHTTLGTLNYMYAYSLYLFFDFAGYSLIAIGVGYILGIIVPENFKLPFLSKDIQDFWNRWHMSLSFWFRDYVYTPFVMASIKGKIFKNRYTASYIGYMITMTLMGIWHGGKIYYILYGIYHGLLIILTDFYKRKSKFYKKNKNKLSFKVVSTVITFNFICFGFLIFSGYLFNQV